jgi:Tat protein secretion system quality control protein TatD with DNase activity
MYFRRPSKISLPVYRSVELHPWHITGETWENDLSVVSEAVKSDGVIAVGETGLDKSIKTEFALQEEVFRLQQCGCGHKNLLSFIVCDRTVKCCRTEKNSIRRFPGYFTGTMRMSRLPGN